MAGCIVGSSMHVEKDGVFLVAIYWAFHEVGCGLHAYDPMRALSQRLNMLPMELRYWSNMAFAIMGIASR